MTFTYSESEEGETQTIPDYYWDYLQLIDLITEGSEVTANPERTSLTFSPGSFQGGEYEFDCGDQKAIGWFLEGILPMCFFCREPTTLLLRGITNDNESMSADFIRNVTLPLLGLFGAGATLTVRRRGFPPGGDGEVLLASHPLNHGLEALHLERAPRFEQVAGLVSSSRLSSHISGKVVAACRPLLRDLCRDVHLYTELGRARKRGGSQAVLQTTKKASPGYAVLLVGQDSSSGCKVGVELTADPSSEALSTPEEVGLAATGCFFEEVMNGGAIDRCHQPLAFFLMSVGSSTDLSTLNIGKELTQQGVEVLRLLRDLLGISFKISKVRAGEEEEEETIQLSCVGLGIRNTSRVVT